MPLSYHGPLIFEGVSELFYDWIGEYVPSDSSDFGFCFRTRKPSIQRELKILALPHAFQSLITHFLESSLDRLSLGIEDTLLQRNVHVSFHGGKNIIR